MGITDLIADGRSSPVLLVAMALLLGGLHGLEPGHSKAMIAAYIIAIRGTVSQAVLLGVSAALSHSLIVWVLALVGLTYGDRLIGEAAEPYFMMASGAIIVLIGAWMLRQAWRSWPHRRPHAAAGHGHRHGHDHAHGPHGHGHEHDHVHDAHGHHHARAHCHGSDGSGHDAGSRDAHALAHARQLEARLGAGRTSTAQTILFGLSGGLVPCPAAITVLLICLQLDRFMLGMAMVAAFSAGLAITLVLVGVAAAVGIGFVSRRSSRFDALLARAPYASAVLICLVGSILIYSGLAHLPARPA